MCLLFNAPDTGTGDHWIIPSGKLDWLVPVMWSLF